MYLGIILLVAGGLLTWFVSGIIGGICILAGVVKLGLSVLASQEPETPKPDYDRGSQTYSLRSSYKK